MTTDLGYGKRLSGNEYDELIVNLHSYDSAVPSRKELILIRRKELNLAIDYRLGQNFPLEKRDALWAIMQQLEKRRLCLMLRYGLCFFLCRNRIPRHLPKSANILAGFMLKEFSNVLTEEELHSFFELEPDL